VRVVVRREGAGTEPGGLGTGITQTYTLTCTGSRNLSGNRNGHWDVRMLGLHCVYEVDETIDTVFGGGWCWWWFVGFSEQ
jgi:hypothetical protein